MGRLVDECGYVWDFISNNNHTYLPIAQIFCFSEYFIVYSFLKYVFKFTSNIMFINLETERGDLHNSIRTDLNIICYM